jgi:hypothetical protein
VTTSRSFRTLEVQDGGLGKSLLVSTNFGWRRGVSVMLSIAAQADERVRDLSRSGATEYLERCHVIKAMMGQKIG